MRLLKVAALLLVPCQVLAQSAGTVALHGKSSNPTLPLITPEAINSAINSALTAKADATGGVLTSPTLAGTVNVTGSGTALNVTNGAGIGGALGVTGAITGSNTVGGTTFQASAAQGLRIGGLNGVTVGVAAGANYPVFVGPGSGAAYPSTYHWSVGLGNKACNLLNTDTENTCVGSLSMQMLTTGNANVGVGVSTLGFETSVQNSTAIGNDSHRNAIGAGSTNSFGSNSGRNGSSVFSQYMGVGAAYGNAASITISGTPTTGDTVTATFVSSTIGLSSTSAHYTVGAGNTLAQVAAGLAAAINALNISAQNVVLIATVSTVSGGPATIGLDFPGGPATGWAMTTTTSVSGAATETMSVGAGYTGGLNVAIGDHALEGLGATTAANLVIVGANSLPWATTANTGVALGNYAGQHGTTMFQFACVGFQACGQSGGFDTVAIGYGAGAGLTGSPNNNVIVGAADIAFQNCITTGQNNIQLGTNACVQDPTGSGQMSIQNIIYSIGGNGAAGATVSTGFLGIGEPAPNARLDVKGTDTGAPLAFRVRDQSGTSRFSIANNGNITVAGSAVVASKTCVASGATLTIVQGLITATSGC